ncbi:MAG: molybdopterin-dependent oxidoreductase [Candidatus Lokiarchaeota archaeon]
MNRVVCTGCSLLCDDIIIKSSGLFIDEVIGACRKGKERFESITSQNRLLNPYIRKGGELTKSNYEEGIKYAIEILQNSSKPLFYGFSTSNCETQKAAIELAKKVNGFIDSNSSICQGKVLEKAAEKGITLSSLTEIINKSDFILFWGFNGAESIPRILNKILFSRGKFRMTGREIKTFGIIDPVKTASFNVMGARDLALRINADEDLNLIRTLKEECCIKDKFPSKEVAGLDQEDLKRLYLNLDEAEYATIIIGQGLLKDKKEGSPLNELLELVQLINKKKEKGRVTVMAIGGHYNMAGFDHVALSLTGRNSGLQFLNNKLIDNQDNIVNKIEKDDFDCSFIFGTDPISHLPLELSKKLASKPMILIENKKTASFYVSDVILPTSITGIESGGLAIRLDHIPIELSKVTNPPNNLLSDEELIIKISTQIER